MKKLKSSRKIVKYIVELDGEGFFVRTDARGYSEPSESEMLINGVVHYKVGTFYSDVYRSDQQGNAIELANGTPKLYKLWELQIAETVDEEGEPSDFLVVGYELEEQ